MSDFPAFGKIPRLHKDVIITEKIDGTNALVSIERALLGASIERANNGEPILAVSIDMSDLDDGGLPNWEYIVKAGSRNRWLTSGVDNYGFSAWVRTHADELTKLGPGLHYGEWYGAGIQRGYGLAEKRFALFNTGRWNVGNVPVCCTVVPVMRITTGDQLNDAVADALDDLSRFGSRAVPDYDHPEGVVVYHTAAGQYFKALLENDNKPKWMARIGYIPTLDNSPVCDCLA